MMANKWVQTAMVFGLGVGFWLSAWINMAYPFASFWLAYPVLAIAVALNLRAKAK